MQEIPYSEVESKKFDISEPGSVMVLDMPNEIYHASPGISSSGLSLVARSPAHFFFAPPRESTRAMVIGSAIHTALLEPQRFTDDYIQLSDVKNRRCAAWNAAAKVHDPDFLLTAGESDNIIGMQEAVYAQTAARAILEAPGKNEVSIFTTDPETGVVVKCRIDILTDNQRAIDVKKTQDARPSAFSRSIFNYRYHAQAAFYSDIFKWASGEELSAFGMLAIEEQIPHSAKLYILNDDAMDLGRALYRKALNTYAECVESATWPGYGDDPEIIGLPVWGEKQNAEEIAEGVEADE